MVNRLRDVLTGIFPALEAAFDYADHRIAAGHGTHPRSRVHRRRR